MTQAQPPASAAPRTADGRRSAPRRQRLLILADSLCLPRDSDLGDIRPDQVYAAVLARHCAERRLPVDVEVDAKEGRTIRGAARALERRGLDPKPDGVIIQIGVVDCAPRILTRRQRKILSCVRPLVLRDRIIRLLHERRAFILTHIRAAAYVKPKVFRRTADRIVTRLISQGSRVALASIAPTTPDMMVHSPPWPGRIDAYNEILRDVAARTGAEYLDLDAEVRAHGVEQCILPDGHHLSVAGNMLYANAMLDLIERWWRTEVPAEAEA